MDSSGHWYLFSECCWLVAAAPGKMVRKKLSFSSKLGFFLQNVHFFQIGELFVDLRTKMLILRKYPNFGEKARYFSKMSRNFLQCG